MVLGTLHINGLKPHKHHSKWRVKYNFFKCFKTVKHHIFHYISHDLQHNSPVELNVRYQLSDGPSNIGRSLRQLMRSVRNSLLGPPVSMASSKQPASSVNFTNNSLFVLYDARLNPRTAPSHTLERLMLNLLQLLLLIT